MELFAERGYPHTTVSEIAERAGVTERTFFRYFADKREVLFSGSEELQRVLREGIASAPAGAQPLEVVALAFDGASALLEERDPRYVRARAALIAKHGELLERELMKLASLGSAIADALRARGVREPTATLAAEAGITAFKVGFDAWVSGRRPKSFALHVREALEGLCAVTARAPKKTSRRRS